MGVRVIKFANALPRSQVGLVISNQILRSGTSVGANVEEAQNSPTKKDFIKCITIALKEARETDYWLRLAEETGLIVIDVSDLKRELSEIIKILISSVKNAKKSL